MSFSTIKFTTNRDYGFNYKHIQELLPQKYMNDYFHYKSYYDSMIDNSCDCSIKATLCTHFLNIFNTVKFDKLMDNIINEKLKNSNIDKMINEYEFEIDKLLKYKMNQSLTNYKKVFQEKIKNLDDIFDRKLKNKFEEEYMIYLLDLEKIKKKNKKLKENNKELLQLQFENNKIIEEQKNENQILKSEINKVLTTISNDFKEFKFKNNIQILDEKIIKFENKISNINTNIDEVENKIKICDNNIIKNKNEMNEFQENVIYQIEKVIIKKCDDCLIEPIILSLQNIQKDYDDTNKEIIKGNSDIIYSIINDINDSFTKTQNILNELKNDNNKDKKKKKIKKKKK